MLFPVLFPNEWSFFQAKCNRSVHNGQGESRNAGSPPTGGIARQCVGGTSLSPGGTADEDHDHDEEFPRHLYRSLYRSLYRNLYRSSERPMKITITITTKSSRRIFIAVFIVIFIASSRSRRRSRLGGTVNPAFTFVRDRVVVLEVDGSHVDEAHDSRRDWPWAPRRPRTARPRSAYAALTVPPGKRPLVEAEQDCDNDLSAAGGLQRRVEQCPFRKVVP